MKRFLVWLAVISTALTFVACGPSLREQFDVAIAEGRLSDAQKLLPEIDRDNGRYFCCTTLIDKYLAIGDIDKAIYVFDRISSHCSMYQMGFENRYSTSKYTKLNSQNLDIISNPSDYTIFEENGKWSHEEIVALQSQGKERTLNNALQHNLLLKANVAGKERVADLFRTFGFSVVNVTTTPIAQ